jgi:hypothetical protein
VFEDCVHPENLPRKGPVAPDYIPFLGSPSNLTNVSNLNTLDQNLDHLRLASTAKRQRFLVYPPQVVDLDPPSRT